MVHNFSIVLFLVHAVGQWVVAYQLVDDGLEHDVEVLHQQILLLLGVDEHLPRLVEESEAEMPQLKGLVGEILIFYLAQAGASIPVEIHVKLLAPNQLKLAVYLLGESEFVADIVEYGEEYHEQLLVEVDLPLLVHRIQVDRLPCLHESRFSPYGLCPVYLVEARVHVLHDEEEETLVVLVELQQLEQDVEISVAEPSAPLPYLGNL